MTKEDRSSDSFLKTLGLHFQDEFSRYFNENKITKPTAIQKKVIPELLNNKSVVVLSETGSGKTLSYALPLASRVKSFESSSDISQQKGSPRCLIIAPTRELSSQIYHVFKDISYHLKMRVRHLSGGDTHTKTKSTSQSAFEVLVATPSRLKSALEKKEIRLHRLQCVVFDEADQLFDMGFKKDLDFIGEFFDLNILQMAFITATLPQEVEEYILEKFSQKKFIKLSSDLSHQPQSRIETFNVKVAPAEKNMVVRMFLEKHAQGRGIIFTNQKNQAEDLFSYLKEKMPKRKMKLLHGGLDKKDRLAAIDSFVEKKAQVLVATDIAARGMDIKDLSWVLNYGLPKTGVYYLHRCGRVARGGRKGIVYNLVASHDAKMIAEINEAIKNQKHLNLHVIPEKKLTHTMGQASSRNDLKEKTRKVKKVAKKSGLRNDEKKNAKGLRGKNRTQKDSHSQRRSKSNTGPKRNKSIRKFR